MQSSRSHLRLPLVAVATLFVAATVFYTGISIYYYSRPQTSASYLGIDYEANARTGFIAITHVQPDSAAEEAGLRKNDIVVAVNGRPLDTLNPLFDMVIRGRPGDRVQLTVRRAGEMAPLELQATLRTRARPARSGLARRMAETAMTFYPVPAALVGLAVLLWRIEDRHAWLLALLFTGLATGALLELEPLIHPSLRGFVVGYSVLLNGVWPAVFYAFFATFPAPSPVDRLMPWLKAALLAVTVAIHVPIAVWCVLTGGTGSAARILVRFGGTLAQTALGLLALGALALGFLSLALNCVYAATPDARRKARLLAWTFAVGSLPWFALTVVAFSTGVNVFSYPFWVWSPCVLLLMLLPVMFAYAVLKHRVLEFSVLVKRSARYVIVQRGFILLTAALSIAVTALFAVYGAMFLPRLTDAALPVGIALGALFGLGVVRTGGAVAKRVERRIDRAFFREAYDVHRILVDLAEKARAVTSRDELASLLEAELVDAFHPRRLALYLRGRGAALELARGDEALPNVLTPDLPFFGALARLARPWSAPDPPTHDSDAMFPLARVEAECLVPLLSRRGHLIGVFVLGPRLSEEPYSRDDKRLLASVAGHAALALESLILAEEIAERMDAERRAAQEVAIAGEVQRRLLPQKTVSMTTLEYAGGCRQARTVGGDYYDFLDLGPGHLGLVLGDVSGKGLYAALLMVNLQASLRSLSARAASDLATTLVSINHSFCESTAGNHFATLFVAHYDDESRRLRYANCGHCPPFLLRADGAIQRLQTTARAVGLFEPWTCETRDIYLGPGDLLAIFSDGVTEAMNAGGEEFGEAAVLATLQANRGAPAAAVLDSVMTAVLEFSEHEQHDDVTMLVARAC